MNTDFTATLTHTVTLTAAEMATTLIALYKKETTADREADRLLQARSSDATPEANGELYAQAMRLRKQAGDCRRLTQRLEGVCRG